VALVSAAMGLGETIGPGLGAALAALHLLAPLYLSAALAVVSALTIWRFLPEEGPPRHEPIPRRSRMRVTDHRIFPFLVVATAMQAARATTVITFAFFLQDRLRLDAQQTVQYSGIAFVVLAVSGLVAQLGIVQRFQPRAQVLMRAGAAFMLLAFLLLIVGPTFAVYLSAMMSLGVGLGLLRPGTAAAASLSVGSGEQGSAAGVVGGVSVIGNVFGPMIGTLLYGVARTGPFVFNAALMFGALVVVLSSRRVRGVRA
jgi:MFS family permease